MFFQKLLFERFLDKDEAIFYSIHTHWITMRDVMFKMAIFGYGVPIIMLVFIFGFDNSGSFLAYLWLIIAMIYTVYVFCDWYLDSWLVTEKSLINTAWDGFFKQRSSRIGYESIESVDIEKKGVKQLIFDYGDIVLVRKSGVNITMKHVASPHLASTWISKVMNEVISDKGVKDSEALKDLLSQIIQDHIRVNS